VKNKNTVSLFFGIGENQTNIVSLFFGIGEKPFT
jgi:hypothetical protein